MAVLVQRRFAGAQAIRPVCCRYAHGFTEQHAQSGWEHINLTGDYIWKNVLDLRSVEPDYKHIIPWF